MKTGSLDWRLVGRTDWRLVGVVAFELLVVRLSLFTLGHQTTARVLAGLTPALGRVVRGDPDPSTGRDPDPSTERGPDPSTERDPDPSTVAETVEGVAGRLPLKTTCLSEALVCEALLDEFGFETDLRVGVAKAGRDLEAHAWLVHRDEVLVGGTVENLGRFETMTESRDR